MAYNNHSNSMQDIRALRQVSRPSNAYHAGTVANWAVYAYTDISAGRIIDGCSTPIPKIGAVYKPTTLDQVTELDLQVTRGKVVKVTL